MSWDTNEYDVVIVGSGISGLGAARVLKNEGFKYLVVEGRNRNGGRIFSEKLPAIDNLPEMHVDLGANYLVGCTYKLNTQPLLALAKEANVETVTCAGDLVSKFGGWECPDIGEWRNYKTGEEIPLELVFHMSHLNDIASSLVYAKYNKMSEKTKLKWDSETSYQHSINEVLELYYNNGLRKTRNLSQLESEVLDSITTRMITYQSPMNHLPINTIRDAATLKAKKNKVFDVKPLKKDDMDKWKANTELRMEALRDYPPCVTTKCNTPGEDRLVTNRFSNFIDYLSIDVPIVQGTIVKKIDYSLDKDKWIIITCIDSSSKQVRLIKTKHCIVTVPVGVLAKLHSRTSICFVPPLPQDKVDSIQRLALPHFGAETHNKIVLRYRPEDVFWNVNAPHLKTNNSFCHILNFHCYGKPGLLVCHVWGGTGIKTRDYTDEQLVNKLLNILQGMYRFQDKSHQYRELPKPIQTIVTRWSEDPFSLGSYTPGGRHSTEADRVNYSRTMYSQSKPGEQDLTKPAAVRSFKSTMPLLLFAGEGTLGDADAQECTHGALISGIKRAAEIVHYHYPRRKMPLDKPFLCLKLGSRKNRNPIRSSNGTSTRSSGANFLESNNLLDDNNDGDEEEDEDDNEVEAKEEKINNNETLDKSNDDATVIKLLKPSDE